MKLGRLSLAPLHLAREYASPPPGPRVPEPMVMDELDSVSEFHEVGAVTQAPIHRLSALATSHLVPAGGTVLDLGSGSGQYLAHLARCRPDLQIVGIDLSDAMLATGRAMLAGEGLDGRVRLHKGDITAAAELAPERLDAISCVQALHHLPATADLARCLQQIGRVRERTGCAVWIFDEARVRRSKSYGALLSSTYELPPALRRDALASERAAFTPAELIEQLERNGLADLRHSSMRLLPAFQIHWAPGRGPAATGHRCWREVPVLAGRRLDTWMFLRLFPGAPINGRAR